MSDLYDAILNGSASAAAQAARIALEAGSGALDLVQRHMVPAMDEVGRRFECEEYFVPELLLSGRAMKAALELIRPLPLYTSLAAQSFPLASPAALGGQHVEKKMRNRLG